MKNASTCTGGCLKTLTINASQDDMHTYAEITEILLFISSMHPKKKKSPRSNFPLRESLFPHVPPYIIFHKFDSKKAPTLPIEITKHLKFLLKKRTPQIIRQTLTRSGCIFSETPSDWYGSWGIRLNPVSTLKTLEPFQKVNVFPGTIRLSRKDHLWTNLSIMIRKFGKKPFDFVPSCYILPRESAKCKRDFARNQAKKWILKPPESDRGDGVRVVHEWCEVPKLGALVVQRYLSNPKLIRGRKFDLRLYVLVTSFNPLRIYLFSEGLVRFATVRYMRDDRHLHDRYMHLTNTSINTKNNVYRRPSSANSQAGDMWSLEALFGYLRKDNVDVEEIWETIKDIVIKTMISVETSVEKLLDVNMSSRYSCYEIFGFDVILDQRYKPWLLEVNAGPSMCTDSSVEYAVKGELIKDVFNIAGYQVPNSLTKKEKEGLSRKYRLSSFCQDLRLYDVELSTEEKNKQCSFVREGGLGSILVDLTPDDVRHLVQYEDELTQIGKFQKIFPTKKTQAYTRYFECPRYYNMLLDAWEDFCEDDRINGVERLRGLCEKKVHLRQFR